MTLDEAIDRAKMTCPECQNLVFNGQEILDLRSMLEELRTFRVEKDMQKCGKCGKHISPDEFAVNWGWCADCLNKDYEEYLRTHVELNEHGN